jgi:hypothetical protein
VPDPQPPSEPDPGDRKAAPVAEPVPAETDDADPTDAERAAAEFGGE